MHTFSLSEVNRTALSYDFATILNTSRRAENRIQRWLAFIFTLHFAVEDSNWRERRW